jgi:hypothetical protein
MDFESVCLYGWAWAIGMVIPGQRVAILDPRLPAMAERIRSVPFPKGSDLSFSLLATAKSMRGKESGDICGDGATREGWCQWAVDRRNYRGRWIESVQLESVHVTRHVTPALQKDT